MLVKYGFFADHSDLVDLPATNISVISDLTEIYEQMRKVMTLGASNDGVKSGSPCQDMWRASTSLARGMLSHPKEECMLWHY
jgi:hypothetical protein